RGWVPAVAWLMVAACGGAAGSGDSAAGKGAPSDKTALADKSSDPAERRLAAGTNIELRSDQTVTSRHNKVGDPVSATAVVDVRDEGGQMVIPRGATFLGTVREIKPAEHPGGQGTLVVSFTAVRLDGRARPINARVTHLATTMH